MTPSNARWPRPFLPGPRAAWAAVAVAAVLAAGCARSPAGALGRPVRAGPVTAVLETVPDPPVSKKEVRFRLRLTGPDGRPLAGGSVTLALSMPGMNHGTNEVRLRPVSPGVYEGPGVLVMAGPWQAAARIEHGGSRTELTIPFRVPR